MTDTSEGISPYWLAAVLLRRRRSIALITALGILVAVVILLVRPARYTTTFTFVPQAPEDPSRAGLASLAGQFGISLSAAGGSQQSPQLYADLLSTRRILAPIADDSFAVDADSTLKVPLATFLDIGEGTPGLMEDNTLRVLRKDVISTSVAVRTTGVVTVNVRTRSPYVSLAIAQRLLTGLNQFNLVTRQSQAREERRFTETRLDDARLALRAAEDELQKFLLNNRQSDYPVLTFQKDRLQREVTLRQDVVTSLAQKVEENRIREVRDTPVLTVIETPILAPRPDARLRAVILLLGTTSAFVFALLVALVRESWLLEGSAGPDAALTQLKREWARFRGAATA